ncbi:MAG: diguanylate cyclase [Leptospiraceae bacterium]|nr:diguanylate cyclase [Leptospiraceae bacterium]MCP5511536.1 diguanylate cyclase [Leptospiraceae bacterium]
MHKKKKLINLIIPSLFFVSLALSIQTFFYELNKIKTSTEQSFHLRSTLIENYLKMVIVNLDVIHAHILDKSNNTLDNQTYQTIKKQIEIHGDNWSLTHPNETGYNKIYGGIFYGTKPQTLFTGDRMEEISILNENYNLFREYSKNLDDIKWLYYISAEHFIFISPKIHSEKSDFSEKLYSMPFYVNALPVNNPKRNLVITELYKDSLGKGLMITLSLPVYIKDRFRGVLSLDIGITSLNRLLTVGQSIGESLLIDPKGMVITGTLPFLIGENSQVDDSSVWFGWNENSGEIWLRKEIIHDEIYLIHKIKKWELYREAIWRSLTIWLSLALVSGLVFFSVRLQRLFQHVSDLMIRDPLTGILNRRGFIENSIHMQDLANRENTYNSFIIFDIDKFKSVNDTYGHDIGDEVITGIANLVGEHLRTYDLFARWGGEEFVILFHIDSTESIPQFTERIRSLIERTPLTSIHLPITVSGGAVLWRKDENLESCIRRADQLLYRAKNGGRNRIEINVTAN